jgi:DNA polymerase-1
MKLLSGWPDRLKRSNSKRDSKEFWLVTPCSPDYYCQDVMSISSAAEIADLLEFSSQRNLSHIGFDFEFCYRSSPHIVSKRERVYDPRSICPLLLSVALADPIREEKGNLYTFVVDLRFSDQWLPSLQKLFNLPHPFVGHFVKSDLFCIWQLDLSEPRRIWDCWVHEKASKLGLDHHYYRRNCLQDQADELAAKRRAKEDDLLRSTLVSTCLRYGVAYDLAHMKTPLQESFLDHPGDAPFSKEQIRYAAEDAMAAARLYPYQILAASQVGILDHLTRVEMEWTITNARMAWNGTRVDSTKRKQLLAACNKHSEHLQRRIENQYGLENARSHKQLREFFDSLGHLSLFAHRGSYSFDKKHLKLLQHVHPSIPLIRALRRIQDLKSSQILSEKFVGEDGRVHPVHWQLGAESGRQTCKYPNILGLERALRPLIVPDQGFGIGEVDYSQMEPGIAAAVYGDSALVDMYNSGDVYSAMAQSFYSQRLSKAERELTSTDFRQCHPKLREQMKVFTLGIIYGMTPVGLAPLLNVSRLEAKSILDKFMEMFPSLKKALKEEALFGGLRGYSVTVNGLRRYRRRKGALTNWERNWLTNFPVQGTAAVIFKTAGNRLDRLFQRYRARLIIPLHDAFVFEAPMDSLEEVASITERVMCDAVQEYFPILRPKVEVNIFRPECWNKDGDAESLDRWLEDPMAEVGIR